MRIQRIEKTEQEATDLTLHTELCAQRYEGLADKLEALDDKLTVAANALVEIKHKIESNNDAVYLKWAIALVTALAGTVLHLLTK